MKSLRILSWNINGIRAADKKGALDWFFNDRPDILCLQETKAHPDQLPDRLKEISGYYCYFNSAEKKGYSGVGLYTREKPLKVSAGLGLPRFDAEGRVLMAEYDRFCLFNVYFPNGKASAERLRYKMDFYDAFLEHVKPLIKAGQKVVVCGDVNTAHNEIDLARPKENENVSGFLPEERAWMDKLLEAGFSDTFRVFTSDPGHYSWWDYKTRARERNVGWRIDYFYISNNLRRYLKAAFILDQLMGSDHCPIGIEMSFK